jgi:hypothetical protein
MALKKERKFSRKEEQEEVETEKREGKFLLCEDKIKGLLKRELR